MIFGSDNFAGAHPLVAASLAQHAGGFSAPYGNSDLDRAVRDRLSDVFERQVAVFFVGTGTAANSLALASLAQPGGVAFAHHEAHVIADECGAPQVFSHGLRICPVNGPHGKMDVADLTHQVDRVATSGIHHGRPSTITVTQPTENGTVYSLDEIDQIAAVAKKHNLPVHMDGARFANALVSLNCTPAEMTWKRGVDILSFGGTKNGCWCAEAVILFDPTKAAEFAWLQKRSAQLFSKSRFIAAQLDAYLHDDLWLHNARHANRMAALLVDVFRSFKSIRLAREPQANEVFVVIPKLVVSQLAEKGVVFLEWADSPGVEMGADESLCRFVTSFATAEEDVMGVKAVIKEISLSLL